METNLHHPREEELLEHVEFVRRLSRSLVSDIHRAEDLAQETLAVAMSSDRPRKLRPWLAGVARNLARMTARTDRRRVARERRTDHGSAAPSPHEIVARLEIERCLVNEVLALPEPYRTTVVCRFFYDMGPTEISRQYEIPVETVRTRLSRSIDRLRTRLDAQYSGRRSNWALALLPWGCEKPSSAAVGTILQGVLMQAKLKTIWILLPLLGLLAGAVGHSWLFGTNAANESPPAGVSPSRLADLVTERDLLLRRNAELAQWIADAEVSFSTEREGLVAQIAKLEAAGGAPGESEDGPPSGKRTSLDEIDWGKWMPLIVKLSEWEPTGGEPPDKDVMDGALKLMAEIQAKLGGRKVREMTEVLRLPVVGSRLAVSAAAHFRGGMPGDDRSSLQKEIEEAMSVASRALPRNPLPIETMAAILAQVVGVEEATSRALDPSTASKVAALIDSLWARAGSGVIHAGELSRTEFVAIAVQLGSKTASEGPAAKAQRGIAERWWESYRGAREDLVSRQGADLVLAVLTDPAEAGDSVIETRKRSDFAGAEIHVRATLAGIQARYEREFYETLTEKRQRSFRGVEASLLLFHPK